MIQKLTIIVLGAFFSLTGCSVLGPVETPTINIYTLNIPASDLKITYPMREKTLLVSATQANPELQSTDMIYAQRAYELKSFARNRWAAPPASMFSALLPQYLTEHGCFRAVVSPPFIGNTDWTLQTRLLTLQQVFEKDSSTIELNMEMTLLDNRTHQIIAHQMIDTKVPATENNPYAGVVAANRATQIMLQKMVNLACPLNF